jgi:D-arabinose 1-dehydrogenase-like Zn-dependent alcohol dehydrogenase
MLVRVDVASICGSDVHQWDGMTPALAPASLPIVLGHEMMGTVVAFGPGPGEDSIGQPLAEGRRKKQYMRTNCERFPYRSPPPGDHQVLRDPDTHVVLSSTHPGGRG